MESIARIINLLGGPAFTHVTLEKKPYMRLSVERIGTGPRGFPAVSVAHYFEQNGDLCQDPEMCFEIVPQVDDRIVLEPYSFQQAIPPVYQEVFSADGKRFRPRLKRELRSFASTWNKNIRQQGFVDVAKTLAKAAVA